MDDTKVYLVCSHTDRHDICLNKMLYSNDIEKVYSYENMDKAKE